MHLLNLLVVAIDTRNDQEREDDLVCLEQTARHVGIDHASNVVDQDLKALLNYLRLGALFDGSVEETLNITERILIHGIDTSEIGNDEVQDTTSDGDRPILVPGIVNLLFDDESLGDTLVDLSRRLLRVLEHSDEGVLVEDLLLS